MTDAAFSAQTTSPGSTFAAAPSFCTSPSTEVLPPVADTYISEGQPVSAAGGTDVILVVQSRASANRRVLVRFAAGSPAAHCRVTSATLRLHTSSGIAGRTLNVQQVTGPWDETVTWGTRPGRTGTPAQATSALGWVQWNVTALVPATGAAGDGLVVMDALEGHATGQTQQFDSRESGANAPQLVVTYG